MRLEQAGRPGLTGTAWGAKQGTAHLADVGHDRGGARHVMDGVVGHHQLHQRGCGCGCGCACGCGCGEEGGCKGLRRHSCTRRSAGCRAAPPALALQVQQQLLAPLQGPDHTRKSGPAGATLEQQAWKVGAVGMASSSSPEFLKAALVRPRRAASSRASLHPAGADTGGRQQGMHWSCRDGSGSLSGRPVPSLAVGSPVWVARDKRWWQHLSREPRSSGQKDQQLTRMRAHACRQRRGGGEQLAYLRALSERS